MPLRAAKISRGVGKPLFAVFPDLRVSAKEVYSAVSLVILAILTYTGLYLSIGKPFLPDNGPAWAIVFIWFIALITGTIVDLVHIPAPLGMIMAGLAMRNIDNGNIISGLKASWSKEFRGIALAIIFLRSGLELDLGIFKRVGPAAVRLLLIPGIAEAFFDGGIAIPIFGMPVTFAFALGFILKAVGPALVIQCMFEVQQRRLGLEKAIPATVVAAASFDDAIAITGYTLFINIAVRGSGSPVWSIMHGPLSIVFGILAGIGAAGICCVTKLWNNAYKRTAIVFILALVMKFFFDKYNFTSGGALGSLTLGLLIKEMWARGWPAWASVEGDHGPHLARSVEKNVRWFWRFIMCPLLFGLIGTTLNFNSLPTGTIPKACAIIFSGLAVRMPITFLVMMFSGFNFREKLFFSFAWTPKSVSFTSHGLVTREATVQATLAALPMDQVQALIPKNSPVYAENMRWAEDALVTAIFCILICGSLGTLLIRYSRSFLLERSPYHDDESDLDDHKPHYYRKSPDPSEDNQRGAAVEEAEEPPQMRRTMSGRYKNPETEDIHPFGIEGRPPNPLAKASYNPDDKAALEDKRQLRAHSSLLANYLDRFETIAEEVEGQEDKDAVQQSADRLRLNVRSLREKLIEDSGVRPPAHEVEGADAFMRASADLRQRHPSLPQLITPPAGASGASTGSENV